MNELIWPFLTYALVILAITGWKLYLSSEQDLKRLLAQERKWNEMNREWRSLALQVLAHNKREEKEFRREVAKLKRKVATLRCRVREKGVWWQDEAFSLLGFELTDSPNWREHLRREREIRERAS